MEQDRDDRIRSLALAGACATFIAVPNLGALLGPGEQTGRYDTVITPPDFAFVVWAPIFAGCAVSAFGQARPDGRTEPISRRTGWPLIGAYVVNTAWSLAAQRDRFALTPYLLPVAAGLAGAAHARLQRVPPATGWAAVTPVSTGLLLGWTALASTVNVVAGAVAAGVDKDAPRTVAASTAALLAASTVVTGVVAASRRGGAAVALASGWGLLTTALTPSRPRSVRLAAAAGASAIAVAAGLSWRRRVTPPAPTR